MMDFQSHFSNFKLPDADSHKGQNGKLMIIGGSDLFHAASKWSLDVASKFVDMVFYSSVPSNNELVKEAKQNFWNGIVIQREEIENYIQEADCVLIGPGMTRSAETEELTSYLLQKYPGKKWVIDAGALQMVEPTLLNENCIITPHYKELEIVLSKLVGSKDQRRTGAQELEINEPLSLWASEPFMKLLNRGVTVVLKGAIDRVYQGEHIIEVPGGNAGMTKGGTGDVLAGLIAALYCTNDALTAAVVGSYSNKKAGEYLFDQVGPFFNASELVEAVPKVMWKVIKERK